MWFQLEEFWETVKFEWNKVGFSGSPSRIFTLKLKALKYRLKVWRKENNEYFKVEKDDCLA